MRKDCQHFYRRSTKDGSAAEGCSLNAAPDAPNSCPQHCQWFEKRKLSTTGFVYGSLAPSARTVAESDVTPPSPEADAVLDDVKALLESVAPSVVEEERARLEAERRRKKRRLRKRLW